MQLYVAGTQSTCEAPPFPSVYSQPFLCAAGRADAPPGLSSPVFTHPQNHFLQEPRSHERGQPGCWPVMKGPLLNTSWTDRRKALSDNTDTALCLCVCIFWHLSSHSFLQPFLIQFCKVWSFHWPNEHSESTIWIFYSDEVFYLFIYLFHNGMNVMGELAF